MCDIDDIVRQGAWRARTVVGLSLVIIASSCTVHRLHRGVLTGSQWHQCLLFGKDSVQTLCRLLIDLVYLIIGAIRHTLCRHTLGLHKVYTRSTLGLHLV